MSIPMVDSFARAGTPIAGRPTPSAPRFGSSRRRGVGSRSSLFLLAVLGALALGRPAGALSLAALSLADLTDGADVVVRGRCIDRVPTHVGGRVESVARFEVLERFAGEADAVVEVRQWGGRSEQRQTVVPGAPLSEPGDEAVLFLAAQPDGSYRIVGVAQGYLPVVPSAFATPVVRVSRTLGTEFAAASAWPLERFAERVRRLARAR